MDDELQKINLFTLGNCAVGKTAFIKRYVENEFEIGGPTVGINCSSKNIKLSKEEELKLLFYDTAGQERYEAISPNLIRDADGILLMYDISDRRTFDSINQWFDNINEIKGENFPIILIGNKCDLEHREITNEEGKQFANLNKFSFMETSSKEGINIEESVKILVLDIVQKKKSEKLKENEGNHENENRKSFKLSSNDKKKKKKKNCCK